MKIRIGFVSNSSSTSFILAINLENNKPCSCCGRKDPDILDLINKFSMDNDDNSVISIGLDNIIKKYIKDWGNRDEGERLKKLMCDYKDENKWKLALVTISQHSPVLCELMEDGIKNKTIVRLMGDL